MSIADAVVSRRGLLFEAMVATADRGLGTSEEDIKQFAWGFINVLEASARGDHSTRDLYLSSVIPALREGPLSLNAVVVSMLRVSAVAACVLGPEHLLWVTDYCSDYTQRLLALWSPAP